MQDLISAISATGVLVCAALSIRGLCAWCFGRGRAVPVGRRLTLVAGIAGFVRLGSRTATCRIGR